MPGTQIEDVRVQPKPYVDPNSTRELTYLNPSADPQAELQRIKLPHQTDPHKLMYREGFQHYLAEMPVIDPKQPDQRAEVAKTLEVLEKIREQVVARYDQLDIPVPPPGEMWRIVLAVEKAKEIDGKLIPGAEVVLALWGEGNTSPVHGHAPGYMHEAMIKGNIDIHMFQAYGDLKNREAVYTGTIQQSEPGVFYSNYRQDVGQEGRMEVIHNFRAREFTVTLHYLPEHVRDGSGNQIKVVNTPESSPPPDYVKTAPYRPGLMLTDIDVKRLTKSEVIETSQVGDVYLIRSQNVPFLGDHYVVITGGMVDKPHGRRPEDLSILIPRGEPTPLDAYVKQEEVIALKLDDDARQRFYNHYDIDSKYRRGSDAPRLEFVGMPAIHSDLEIKPEYAPAHVAAMNAVLDVIEERRQCYAHEAGKPWLGRDAFLQRALELTRDGQPLLMAFPGFPFKSANHESKTLGPLPDMAERLSISNLCDMCREIEKVYPPGARFLVATDGLPFNPLFRVSDGETLNYLQRMQELARGSTLSFTSMIELVPEGETLQAKREYFEKCYAKPPETVNVKIEQDPTTLKYYSGLKFFMEEDLGPIWQAEAQAAGKPAISKNAMRRMAGEAARDFIRLNDAYNELVAERLPPALRVSCHPQEASNTSKVGINLIFKQQAAWGTPWQNAVVLCPDGKWELTRKADALKAGYVLVQDENGNPSHFMKPA